MSYCCTAIGLVVENAAALVAAGEEWLVRFMISTCQVKPNLSHTSFFGYHKDYDLHLMLCCGAASCLGELALHPCGLRLHICQCCRLCLHHQPLSVLVYRSHRDMHFRHVSLLAMPSLCAAWLGHTRPVHIRF
jgi:hypothetical protein